MKLDQLHADADLLRRHSLPLAAAQRHAAGAGAAPLGAGEEAWDAEQDRSVVNGSGHRRAVDDANEADPLDGVMPSLQRAALFNADDEPWPAPPPPTDDAMSRSSWLARLAELAARTGARREAAFDEEPRGDRTAASPRQVNLAPWLAGGVVAIVLLALAAGLLSHQRIDAEAAQIVDAKRRAAEQALALLHSAERPATAVHGANAPAAVEAPAAEPVASPRADTPAEARARHDAMLASIKSGTVLASLPPSALVQPSALPADLPPALAATAASPRAAPVAVTTKPAKKVALVVEGAPVQAARSALPADPLAATRVQGTLKGASHPQHRVYQLRESDGEWLGFVARADADPLADGVWAGSGDLLTGGWRVAEVTAQRLTLVGANGALEILRP